MNDAYTTAMIISRINNTNHEEIVDEIENKIILNKKEGMIVCDVDYIDDDGKQYKTCEVDEEVAVSLLNSEEDIEEMRYCFLMARREIERKQKEEISEIALQKYERDMAEKAVSASKEVKTLIKSIRAIRDVNENIDVSTVTRRIEDLALELSEIVLS
jgi:hypothetical protein